MIKHMMFAVVAVVCLASQGFARHPFVNDPVSDTPSVLVKAQAPAADAPVADAPVADAAVAAEVGADAVPAQAPVDAAAPMASEGEVAVESNVVPASEPGVTYRTVRSSRRSSNGFLGELIELERRKNAWIRRNIFGR